MSKQEKFIKAQKLSKKQGVPKGANPATHERCIQHLKEKGHDKESAFAICNAAGAGMKKSEVKMDLKEFVKEHKRLIQVLESPSKKDDKKEAKRQKKELQEETKKSEGAFHGYKDTQSTVDVQTQTGAELTASPELIQYLTASINADLEKVRLEKGTLTVHKKEEGLYSGFFQDNDGQVVQEFQNVTIPILAKTLELKNLYNRPVAVQIHNDDNEDRAVAKEEAARITSEAMAIHNDLYHKGQEPGESLRSDKGYVRIKYGNFELEIKKSMHDFVKAHREARPQRDDIRKALAFWRRNSKSANQFRTDVEAAQALVSDWNQYGEEFNQALFVVKMRNEKR